MSVEVVSRPHLPSETELPEKLLEILDSHGLRASWQQNSQQLLSTYHGMGMRPVTKPFLADVGFTPEEVGLFFFSPEGHLQKQDCVLMVEPKELHEQRVAVEREITRRREGASDHVEALDEEIARTMRAAGVNPAKFVNAGGLFAGSTRARDARDYVKVTKKPG